MDNDQHAEAASRTPTIREELEGFVRSLFSPPEAESAPRLIAPPPPPAAPLPPDSPPSPEAMLDAEKQQPKTNGRVDVTEQVGVMLRDLFESQDTFVISNAGVQAIIDGLLRRYRASE